MSRDEGSVLVEMKQVLVAQAKLLETNTARIGELQRAFATIHATLAKAEEARAAEAREARERAAKVAERLDAAERAIRGVGESVRARDDGAEALAQEIRTRLEDVELNLLDAITRAREMVKAV